MKNYQIIVVLLVVFLAGCRSDDQPDLTNPNIPDINDSVDTGNPNSGNDNQELNNIEALGRLLFWDPILSGEQDVACATCHHPSFGYADGRALPIGVGGQGLGPKDLMQ